MVAEEEICAKNPDKPQTQNLFFNLPVYTLPRSINLIGYIWLCFINCWVSQRNPIFFSPFGINR